MADTVKIRHRLSLLADHQQQPLQLPEGVVPVGESELIACDTGNQRLVRYRAAAEFEYQPVAVIKVPQLRYPTKVQRDLQGDLLVLDRESFRLVRLSPEGAFRGYVGSGGSASAAIKSFSLDANGNIYLLELPHSRVRVLTPAGELLREISTAGDAVLTDVVVDRKGRLLAVDATRGIVYEARPQDTVLKPVTDSLKPYARFPARIATDDRGRIYLSDRNGCRIVILSQAGAFLVSRSARGYKEGLLQFPGQLWVKGDSLYIADTRNDRIQVFSLSE